VNTKVAADKIAAFLQDVRMSVGVTHSDMTNENRISVYNQLKASNMKILVTTDISSRGLDIQSIDLVINFSMPINNNCYETYVHRIGRCGRHGRVGKAINFVTEDETDFIDLINQRSLNDNGKCIELPARFAEI
jgi:superfamily II DNA/RNA helicase